MTGKFDKVINNSLCEIKELLKELVPPEQQESLTPLMYCDEECNVTGGISFIRDENTPNSVIQIYFDSHLNITTKAPTGTLCSAGCTKDYEFKFFETEKCLTDGTKIKEILCLSFIDGIEETSSIFWVVEGVKIKTNPGTINCIDCTELGSVGTVMNWNILKQ